MKQIFTLLVVFLISHYAIAQSEWDSWNKNYQEINITELISSEKIYADSVDRGLIEGNYYLRMDSYRFSAVYSGERREIPDSIKASMKRVYTVYGHKEYLRLIDDVRFEYQFMINGEVFWISMQSILDKPFKKEVRKDDTVYLYCLFLNEHGTEGELFNSLLINEFRK